MKRPLVGFKVLVLAILLATPMYAADEVRIVRGTLFQALDATGILSVEGTSGVRMDAALSSIYATPAWKTCFYHACQPGDVVSLRVSYGAHPAFFTGSGEATIHGQTYSLFDDASADLQFDGAVVIPDLTDGVTAELSAPFVFSGSLQVPNRLEPGTYDIFELHGAGVATVTLYPHPYSSTGWIVGSVRYEFTPRGNTVITP